MRYKLIEIYSAAGVTTEREIGEFDAMDQACDESYRRFGKPFITVVCDSETNERWSHREMLAGGFSNLCTKAEWMEARRQLGMHTPE